MRLSEILKVQNIRIPLSATTKSEAIAELVNVLADSGDVPREQSKRVLDAVLEREATRTTGIGNGLAIPHGKAPATTDLVMAIGKPAQPIDFQSIDGKPVSIIWLLSSPPDKTSAHIHALARISRLMTIERFRHALVGSRTPQEMFDAIVQQESQL
ncbi:MAG: PTS sugar transporter subunit IIA [Tepidisphaeraceae bacterium]